MSAASQSAVSQFLNRVAQIGAEAGDSNDIRLQKSLLVLSAGLTGLAGLLWGGLYLALNHLLPAAIPLGYSVLTALSTGLFAASHSVGPYRFRQLLLILLLPFLLMLSLGGFVNSGAVILWSLLSPLGALLLSNRREALGWFTAYVGAIVISLAIQPYIGLADALPPAVIFGFFALNIVGPSTVAFVLVLYFVGQKDRFLRLLRVEQEKSEGLLLNILPPEIAAVLKTGRRTIADHYDGASILFADLVGFTPLSAELPPAEMVELLNQVFSHFDNLVERYGVEKIRTIGDSYMVAAGVPRPRPDHAHALASMALDMVDYCAQQVRAPGRPLEFRIGINSGPVVAGVIGRKKFIYDLWGDAVNTASRMESHGEAGKIQITRATYEIVKDDFECEYRGRMQVKGKGEMETWFLLGRRAGGGQAAGP